MLVLNPNKSEKPSHLYCIGDLSRGLYYYFTGCPAKTVNRHKGGAVLLKEPELIHDIVHAVRSAVPGHIPVSAKMRLGYLDGDLAIENASAIESAGATSLAVHARTKLQAYRPPAHWEELAAIRKAVNIPVIANGDIFTADDARRCREVSGCRDIMIGRGILRDPDLPVKITSNGITETADQQWQRSLLILQRFTSKVLQAPRHPDEQHPYFINNPRRYLDGRLKQWLSMMSKKSEGAKLLFDQIKTRTSIEEMSRVLQEAA